MNAQRLFEVVHYFAKNKNIPHDWAFLEQPGVLNVKYTNKFTLLAKHMSPNEIAVDENNDELLSEFIDRQDRLRNIDIKDYFNFLPR